MLECQFPKRGSCYVNVIYKTYQKVAQQNNNGHLANGGNKNRGLLLDLRAEVLDKMSH